MSARPRSPTPAPKTSGSAFGSDAGASIFSADADGLQSEESSDGPPAAGADCCELTPELLALLGLRRAAFCAPSRVRWRALGARRQASPRPHACLHDVDENEVCAPNSSSTLREIMPRSRCRSLPSHPAARLPLQVLHSSWRRSASSFVSRGARRTAQRCGRARRPAGTPPPSATPFAASSTSMEARRARLGSLGGQRPAELVWRLSSAHELASVGHPTRRRPMRIVDVRCSRGRRARVCMRAPYMCVLSRRT